MSDSPISDDTLARLKRERAQADAVYNEALTALDRAVPAFPALREEAAPQAAVEPGTILPSDPLASFSGWRRRLAGFVWRLVGPMLQRQQEINAAVAGRLAAEQTARLGADREKREALECAFAALARFHAHLVHYLQQITLFVETKDRDAVATVHRYLSDGLSGLADELAKRWESIAAREQRHEARVSALADTQARTASDIQSSIASLQQLSHVMKREMERLLAGASATPQHVGSGLPFDSAQGRQAGTAAALDSYKYVAFEDRFRGSEEDIRARLADYLPHFEGASDLLDVGCGRGEFLELLGGRGIRARGIDLNHEMVERCRARGFDVAEGDALDYLESLPDGSLGGLFAAQVVEHLEPERLIRLLDAAFSKLRPGARIVLETINPACWAAFFESYIRDLTHVRPVHPDTLAFLLQASGFQAVDVQYRAPYPETARLQPIAVPAPSSAQSAAGEWTLVEVAEAFNANVARLNALLFTYLDYAAIATRG